MTNSASPDSNTRFFALPFGARTGAVIMIAAALAIVGFFLAERWDAPENPTPDATGGGNTESPYHVRTIAENLRVPWAMDFAPDGRIFFTQRGGEVFIIQDGIMHGPALNLDVGFVEGGLLGIALDPHFEDNHYVYLYYTYSDLLSTHNRVARYTEEGNKLADELTLIDGIPGGPVHDGGRIRFGGDGKLYVTTGDASNPALAQDKSSLAGKILRINPDGSIPDDNPFKESPVFSYGHRNPQGLDWHSSGTLYITEHGPSGERGFAHDEINAVRGGQNFGWPELVGDESGEGMRGPVLHSGDVTWAPSGASFYDSDAIPEWSGKLLVATLAGRHMMAVNLDADPIVAERYFVGEYGRLRDVTVDGLGNVYLLTSNQDGRGSPAPNDDRILKVSAWP